MKVGDVAQYYQEQYDEILRAKRMNPMMTISPEGEIREVMTLRDHFAGLAMQSLMPLYWDTIAEYSDVRVMMKSHVEAAYEYADAMLKQRSL